jgi:chromosome segregation protein
MRAAGSDGQLRTAAGLVPAARCRAETEGRAIAPSACCCPSVTWRTTSGAFLEFWKANPGDSAFLAVATARATSSTAAASSTAGTTAIKSAANSIVQREIDFRETARPLADDQKQHDDQKAVIDALTARLAEAEQTLEQRRSDVLAATQTLAAVQADQRGAQRNADDIGNRLNRMEQELDLARAGATTRRTRAGKRRRPASPRRMPPPGRTAKRIRRRWKSRIVEVRTDRDVKRETLAHARLELAERRQKVEVIDRGLGEMERRRQQLSELLVQRQTEIESWSEQVASELEQESAEEQRAGRPSSAETLVVAQEQVEKVRLELAELERGITAVEAAQARPCATNPSPPTTNSVHARGEARGEPPARPVPRRGGPARVPDRHRRRSIGAASSGTPTMSPRA